ncbi:MAG: hypothetical protein RLZZ604_1296 [Pseudomonadota bacterium]
MNQLTVSEAVLSRRSIRAFKPDAVPLDVLHRVMDMARWAPSGCNFQPWEATILTGEPLAELQKKMLASPMQDPPEYSWSEPEVIPECKARLQQVGASMYQAMGIGMGSPQWSDVGMWLQTIMLLLRGEGLDTCPQEFLAMHAKLIKEFIGVSDETHIFFCGIAIGYRDEEAAVNAFERQREPVEGNVRFMGF